MQPSQNPKPPRGRAFTLDVVSNHSTLSTRIDTDRTFENEHLRERRDKAIESGDLPRPPTCATQACTFLGTHKKVFIVAGTTLAVAGALAALTYFCGTEAGPCFLRGGA